jgi:beta-glucosidase
MTQFLSKKTLSLIICGLFASSLSYAQVTYPKMFLWGVAFSAHQTEGLTGGGENGDWYTFEHPSSGKSPITNGDTADVAVDHWNRFDEDFGFAQQMGVNSLRTSLAWEKIEPARGVFSTEAIQHYRLVLQSMREHGIRPMIALHHYTNPRWFMDRGGWLNEDSPRLFLEYATYVVQNLGDLCDLWITFNEPVVYVQMAYLGANIPPQMSSLDSAYEAAFEIARAHRMVTAMIHEKQGLSADARGPDGELRGVSIANAFALFDPYNPRVNRDLQAASALTDLNNWDFVQGIFSDRLKFEIPAEVPGSKNFERRFPVDDLPLESIGQPMMDWIGVNYYMRWLIKYDAASSLRADWITPPGPLSDNGWSIYPRGLEKVLRQTAAKFPGVPLVVTENGLADANDSKRSQFIRDHLASLDHALLGDRGLSGTAGPKPLDVRGYFHWSLMDNFEWLSGYSYRFGLVEIQYDHGLKRVPRPSATVYRQEIQKRR